MTYEEIAWFPLCLTLSVLGMVAAVLVGRRRGVVPAARVAGWALLPMGFYLVGAVDLLWRIGTAITRFVTGFAFSPKTWAGVAVLALAAVLLLTTGVLRSRGIGSGRGARAEVPAATPATGRGGREPVGAAAKPSRKAAKSSPSGATEGFEDIEEILRRRGIS